MYYKLWTLLLFLKLLTVTFCSFAMEQKQLSRYCAIQFANDKQIEMPEELKVISGTIRRILNDYNKHCPIEEKCIIPIPMIEQYQFEALQDMLPFIEEQNVHSIMILLNSMTDTLYLSIKNQAEYFDIDFLKQIIKDRKLNADLNLEMLMAQVLQHMLSSERNPIDIETIFK